ncbi:cadherin-like domain-containing protein [Bradyrhizobium diazoefficiens]|uniref:cadherin-like domain-containing protein n=1 Tax=Bradyrhizobium diazoefficiens TaxID=1355477 RepID=UPI00272CCDFB|nr:cadherin-like domain-containing protein [Bradyrhizobium diazoefficiens]WLA62323.1 cadherin-like domain-containing protein [Bradyrhizobium diazoefficiens]
MPSNNPSNKAVLYSYNVGNVVITVYNDGTETVSNYDSGTTKTITGNQSQTIADNDDKATIIYANNAGDTIDGSKGSGNDAYFGGNGKDVLWAGSGNVYLDGNNGSDILHGGKGTTTLVGGNGGDVLYGGIDGNKLVGVDTFLYRAAADSPYTVGGAAPVSSPNGWDIVQNFEHGKDKIDFTVLEDTQVGAAGTTQLTGAGPDHLVWRGAVQSDAQSGVTNSALAHSVWTDKADSNGNTHFLYADINGDGKADIKIQIDDAQLGDFNGVTGNHGPTTGAVTLAAIAEDSGTHLITQAMLLVNASDIEGDQLTASDLQISGGSGSLVNNGNGTWTYTPAPNDDTSVSFSYKVSDGFLTAAGSATLDITPVNDAPTTGAVTLTAIAEDSGAHLITQAMLLASASDIEGDQLTASNLQISGGSGSLIDHGDGTWSYTPASNDDTAVSFSYTITDNGTTNGLPDPKSVAGSATLDITPVNDAPTTGTVTLTAIAEDSGAHLITQAMLLASASDIEGDQLTASNLQISGGSGSLIDHGDGTWSYTPASNDDTAVSFSYTITDNGTTNGLPDPKSVAGSATLDITPVNDAPTTGAVTLTAIAEDSGAHLITQAMLLTSASDIEGDQLTASNLQISGGSGSLIDHGDGTWSYTPASNDDTAVSFSYTITDNGATNGLPDPKSVAGSATLDITPVNDAPAAVNDSYNLTSGTPLVINAANGVLANDLDVDTAHASLTAILNAGPAHGTLVLNSDGSFTYTADAGYSGTDSFTYSDGSLGSNTASVNLTIAPPPNGVTSGNDHLIISQGVTALDITDMLLANDTVTPAGTNFYISTINTAGLASGFSVTENSTTHHVFISIDTNFPANGKVAPDTSFTYTLHDASGNESTATATVTAYNVNTGANQIDLSSMTYDRSYIDALSGNDNISAGSGVDKLIGGAGNDTIAGGPGADTLTGNAGSDHFLFNAVSEGVDTITDFTHGTDSIDFAAAAFGNGLAVGGGNTGNLDASHFLSGGTEGTFSGSGAGFWYNSSTSTLYYDANGNTAGGLISIAQLTGNPIVSNTDLHLV